MRTRGGGAAVDGRFVDNPQAGRGRLGPPQRHRRTSPATESPKMRDDRTRPAAPRTAAVSMSAQAAAAVADAVASRGAEASGRLVPSGDW